MATISSVKDPVNATLTMVAEFDAPVERVWQVWEDPRQLERWWGPPTWPATFERHRLEVGSDSTYYMTGPEGETSRGWWDITAVDAPRRLEFTDGFAKDDGERDTSIDPIRAVVTFEATATGTRMTTVSRFTDTAHLAQLEEMGMEEGMTLAMGQIEGILAGSSVGSAQSGPRSQPPRV
ncbi:MAG: SRPBCC domain-containing protein [Burkholderiaceae bacterium]|nr:SRPBCC domain-containing protein [Microbacteriaceae bacterium]